MLRHLYSTYVYMDDTDSGGYVYHANYLRFAERARTEMLRDQGIDQRFLQQSRSMFFVVRECKIDYLLPARLDDFLEIQTEIYEVTGTRLFLTQKILRDHVEVTNLSLTLVLVSEGGRPLRIPAFLREALSGIIMN
ncbi:MAG: YbgC/FadM family acyl-CoA thioesterase [Candidatus Paracaedimonas acanthamoebae]|uniref:YbgC/FadM family acyl-CoA thioesterase n=1 Tax=Candidatus Paracaedimonas acanthamoebae TaxID=244581 RepID=A0A8J7PJW2_9PROT|nr:YbgC/FadM family acyl-CoA thioesterase [Candidatus Paracaedimonas acanthamoebae]